ncbi:MAG: glycosyltransferase family 4 protein [Polyangiaceae bacterium]|nr:glycosyltransferase family 4 protein [Polyangiaceae bacterium]
MWRELAHRPGIALTVLYGKTPGDPPSVEASGFNARFIPECRLQIGGRAVYWHGPHWEYATAARTDVFVFGWNLNYLSLVPGLVRARANRVGTILWGHGYSTDEAPLRAAARRAVSELAHALVFYAEPAAAEYRARGGAPERLFVAANALDQTEIQAARHAWLSEPGRLSAFREERGLGSGPVLLFVARLDAAKRADLLLRAAAELRADYSQLRVLIVGSGPEERRLRTLATSLCLGEAVQFLGAVYDEAALAPLFLCADLFCFPGSIGLSILHAFGYGLPVVTHADRQRHHPEIAALRDGENGLLFDPPGNVAALARTLREILGDAERRRVMGLAAHRTATETFTVPRMIDGAERAIRFAAAAVGR